MHAESVNGTKCKAAGRAVSWVIWNKKQQHRSVLQVGPELADVAANVSAVAKAEVRDGAGGEELCWAATVHVLDSTRHECFVAAEVALAAALEGKGDWEKVEDVFAV